MMGTDRRMLRAPLGFGRSSPPPGVPCFASSAASAQSPRQCPAPCSPSEPRARGLPAAVPRTAGAVQSGTAPGSSVCPEGQAGDPPPYSHPGHAPLLFRGVTALDALKPATLGRGDGTGRRLIAEDQPDPRLAGVG